MGEKLRFIVGQAMRFFLEELLQNENVIAIHLKLLSALLNIFFSVMFHSNQNSGLTFAAQASQSIPFFHLREEN